MKRLRRRVVVDPRDGELLGEPVVDELVSVDMFGFAALLALRLVQ